MQNVIIFDIKKMETLIKLENPIVWIDLELTGLDIEKDHIVEIAVILTDGNLDKEVYGPNLQIHYSDEILNNMSTWCTTTFKENGLLEEIKKSKITLSEAENLVLDFVKKYVPEKVAPLAGNSCYCDRIFIRKDMPKLDNFLHTVNLDVSSIGQCCFKWKPEIMSEVEKSGKHRGLDDIKESIKELRIYKKRIFNK